MALANINNIESVKEIYTLNDHKEYLKDIEKQEGRDNDISYPYYPMICVSNFADDDGHFHFCHGSFQGRVSDYDSDVYINVSGSYESMIKEIINVAKW